MRPDYKRIYLDILQKKYPEKLDECKPILLNDNLSSIDINKLNEIIFGKKTENQKFKSYKRSDISKILDYQKKHKLNNIQLAKHFKMSRNTITKYKKIYK